MKKFYIALAMLVILPSTSNAEKNVNAFSCSVMSSSWIRAGSAVPSFPWNHYFIHYNDFLSMVKNSNELKPYYDNYMRSCKEYISCTNTEPYKSYSIKVDSYIKRTGQLCDSQHPNNGQGWQDCMKKLNQKNINKVIPEPTYCNKYHLREHESGVNLRTESRTIAKEIIARIEHQ